MHGGKKEGGGGRPRPVNPGDGSGAPEGEKMAEPIYSGWLPDGGAGGS
jgi:hypothetical protein